jgi:GNAT superfamily N-acetyltransferase
MAVAANIRVEAISSPQAFEEFARLPFDVYADREAWWPPDIRNEVDLLSGRTKTAPYLELQPFCAWREGKLVARVSAVVNRRYISHWGQQLGQLIHFEAVADVEEAVSAMLDRAMQWLARRGMRAVRSGFAAFLDYPYAIDNYGSLPSFLLRANPEYYHRYLKDAGFETEKGQIDYTAELTTAMLRRYEDMVEACETAGVSVKSWREYGFTAAVDAWTDLTNAAFARHWGWNPVTREEVRPMMNPLRGTLVGDLSMLAVKGDEVVGVVFSVPDLSPVLAEVRSGVKLNPDRGGGTRGALINIGVLEAMRGKGIGVAMAARSFLTMASHAMRYAGYTLVLDDNLPSRRAAIALGARVTGNFVTYSRAL